MNELQIFRNTEFGSVRTVTVEGEPWFVGKDVAKALGYTNTRKALSDHVGDEDKAVTKCPTTRGMQSLTIINASGVYSLVFRSRLPGAKRFKRWVTHDVLPSIRKRSLYTVDEILENPERVIEALLALKEERQKRKTVNTAFTIEKF